MVAWLLQIANQWLRDPDAHAHGAGSGKTMGVDKEGGKRLDEDPRPRGAP